MMNTDYIDKGKLQVSVWAGNVVTPIQGAQVKITDSVEGSVIAELKTDSSGQTNTIELPAPPIEYSLRENGNRPYSTYNVTVDADEFEKLHIGSVQILSGSTSIQSANLKLFLSL